MSLSICSGVTTGEHSQQENMRPLWGNACVSLFANFSSVSTVYSRARFRNVFGRLRLCIFLDWMHLFASNPPAKQSRVVYAGILQYALFVECYYVVGLSAAEKMEWENVLHMQLKVFPYGPLEIMVH